MLKVTFKPNTLQQAYLKMPALTLEPDILKFNDGSIRVTLPGMHNNIDHHYCTITSSIESMDDLMIVAQIKDIVERHSKRPKQFEFEIIGTPYTRYDRVMFADKTDAFGAKVFADFVNSLNFDIVYLYDCHSQVMLDHINNSYNVDQDELVYNILRECTSMQSDFNIVAPDKGATKKLKYTNMVFDKVRNVETGQITGMEIVKDDSFPDKEFLVIDDICEGGRTFIELAKLFKQHKSNKLNLYVTHGIFSNNALEKLVEYYDTIYVYFMKEELYDSLNSNIRSKLEIFMIT